MIVINIVFIEKEYRKYQFQKREALATSEIHSAIFFNKIVFLEIRFDSLV